MFQVGLVPTTNEPTRITKEFLLYIITNSITYNEFKTTILAADIPDHFPIIYAFKLKTKLDIPKAQFLLTYY